MLTSHRVQNLSGRTLRRLPGTSLLDSRQNPCPIDEALEALSQAVDNELSRGQKEDRTEEAKTINFF